MDTATLRAKSKEVAAILKVIAHEKRLLLLCYLSQGEKDVSELVEACNISQSQTSQFLKRLEYQGFVSSSREGRYVYYQIKDPQIKTLMKSLEKIYC